MNEDMRPCNGFGTQLFACLYPFDKQAWCEIEQVRHVFASSRTGFCASEVDWHTTVRHVRTVVYFQPRPRVADRPLESKDGGREMDLVSEVSGWVDDVLADTPLQLLLRSPQCDWGEK